MSAAPAITLRCCATCAGVTFGVVEIEGQLYLRCAGCHMRLWDHPETTPRGALVNIEEARYLTTLTPSPASASALLKAYRQSAAELTKIFMQNPKVLS